MNKTTLIKNIIIFNYSNKNYLKIYHTVTKTLLLKIKNGKCVNRSMGSSHKIDTLEQWYF